MNTLTKTITTLISMCLLISNVAASQETTAQEMQDVLATEVKESAIAGRENEIAAREARRQAEIARKQVEANRKQTDASLRQLQDVLEKSNSRTRYGSNAIPVSAFSSYLRNHWPSVANNSATSVLVIPSANIEAKDLLTINEDLTIMSRIFEKNLQDAHITPAGSNIFVDNYGTSALLGALSGRGSSSIQSLYLQGYGALFLMKVDFPLSPPPQEQEADETEKEQNGDKIWEETRTQLYEPEKLVKSKATESTEKYDAQKVELLKTTLIKVLKHAANIRNLKPDESVILTVTGSGGSAGIETVVVGSHDQSDGKRRFLVRDKKTGTARWFIEGSSLKDLGLNTPTIMVIRAKKADIDSFVKGDLDVEQFRQRVNMFSYPYLGGG